MIVCICNEINDKQFEDACKSCPSACNAKHLMSNLGAKPKCGQCLCYIEEAYIDQPVLQTATC